MLEVYKTFDQGIEQIFDHLCQLFEAGDYTQLHLEAVSLHDFLYSPSIHLNNVNATEFLDWVGNLLQCKRELCFHQILILAVIIVKAIGCRVCRTLHPIP